MLTDRIGHSPVIAGSARIAPTVSVVGNAVIIRSVGGAHRPAFSTVVGPDSLIGPGAALAGCEIGSAVDIATQAMVFHGARVGDGTRLGAGCIVHTGTNVPERSRVGMRQIAVRADDGGVVITSDLTLARAQVARADFFDRAFNLADDDLVVVHRRSVEILRQEAADWDDMNIGPGLSNATE